MPSERMSINPVKAAKRKAVAERRIGVGQACACGESDPLALVKGTNPIVCAKCQRLQAGKNPLDKHHVAGRNNHPATISVPVNDHRAILSAAQYEWPKDMLQNPENSPVMAAAACIRGAVDTIKYVLDTLLSWIVDALRVLDGYLSEKLGPKWWLKSPIANVTRNGGANA